MLHSLHYTGIIPKNFILFDSKNLLGGLLKYGNCGSRMSIGWSGPKNGFGLVLLASVTATYIRCLQTNETF